MAATSVSLWSDYQAAMGQRLALPGVWETCEWTESVGNDFGGAVLVLPRELPNGEPNPALASVAVGNVLRIVDVALDGTKVVYEYRISGFEDQRTSPAVTARAVPFIYDLGRVNLRVPSGVRYMSEFDIVRLTPQEIIEGFVLPALAADGLSYVECGALDSARRLSFSFRGTALGMLQELARRTASDLWMERAVDGLSWAIRLGTQGAAAPMPHAIVGRNVEALDRVVDANSNFFTRCEGLGATVDGETQPSDLGDHLFAATPAGLGQLELSDPDEPNDDTVLMPFDGMLDGLRALIPIDDGPGSHLVPPPSVSSHPVAFDATNRRVWWVAGGDYAYFYTLPTKTRGRITLATGAQANSIAVKEATGEVFVACTGDNRIRVATTAGVTSTWLALLDPPIHVVYLAAMDRVVVFYQNGVRQCEVRQTNGAGATAITGSDNSLYNFNNCLYWPTGPGYIVFVGQNDYVGRFTTGLAGTIFTLGAGGSTGTQYFGVYDDTFIGIDNGRYYYTLTPMTGPGALAKTFMTGDGFPVVASRATAMLTHGTDLYAALAGVLFRFAVALPAKTPSIAQRQDCTPAAGGSTGYLAFRDSTRNCIGMWVPGEGVRWFTEGTLTPILAGDVASMNAGLRLAAVPAVDPARIPPGAVVQFREDSSGTYVTRLAHPENLQTYGAIDGRAADRTVIGKANWCRAGRALQHESDWDAVAGVYERPVGIARQYGSGGAGDDVADKGEQSSRWRASDYVGAPLAAVTSAAAAAGATSVSLTGMTPHLFIAPGSVVALASVGTFTGVNFCVVRARAQVSAGGTVTLTTTPVPSGGFGSGVAITLRGPTLASIDDLPECGIVLYQPDTATAPGRAVTAVPLPSIAGDTTVRVIAHVAVSGFGGDPANVTMTVRSPDGSSVSLACDGGSPVTDGSTQESWLSARVELGSEDGYVGIALNAGTLGTVVHILGLYVMLSAGDPTLPATNLPAFAGGNALWRAAVTALKAWGTPPVSYAVRLLEDDPDRPFTLGGSVYLRDPQRGIAAEPRVVQLVRRASVRGRVVHRPEVVLNTHPASLLKMLAEMEA